MAIFKEKDIYLHLLFYRYMLTPKDAERYQSFKGSPSKLHVVDQFMLEVRKHGIKTHHELFLGHLLLDKTT